MSEKEKAAELICRNCETPFVPRGSGNWAFCSIQCAREFKLPSIRARHNETQPRRPITTMLTIEQILWVREQAAMNGVMHAAYLRELVERDIAAKRGKGLITQ
jgi:hypothetical protein